MTDPLTSQEYLKQQFDDLSGRLEKVLAHIDPETPLADRGLRIPDQDLRADIGEPSPLATFVRNVQTACDGLIKEPEPDLPIPLIDSNRSSVSSAERVAEFITAVQDASAARSGTIEKGEEMRIATEVTELPKFKDVPWRIAFLQTTQARGLDEGVRLCMDRLTIQQLAQQVSQINGLSPVTGNAPSDEDWKDLHTLMLDSIRSKVCGCSLIYSYWLDEGGLQIAIERVADRVENGIVSSTEALKMLHISESSDIVANVSSFITSWQRGELFDVDARRKQYQAQYGFPLYAARAWGSLTTADPRSVFPASFHRFLYEASRYYESQRDRMKDPDIGATQSAIGQLRDALLEGNENMRRKRTAEIRGFSEYSKRLLGGSELDVPIEVAWRPYLTGRPGVVEAKDTKPWQIKVDAVASAYGWSRPRVKEYTALAEAGETILVATRVGGQAATKHENVAKAFAELVKPYVVTYINAFKLVGGVDLGQKLVTASPAAIMARGIRPPAIPPLKRHWAAIAPAGNQSNAA